jgi:hypothetical protein
MPTLTDLQQAAQGNNTLGGIKSNTGVAPSNAQTASSLGAVPNAAQMAGTPQQQKAAMKEAVGTQGTLGELQRTATGRVQSKEGQSQEALDKVVVAKELAGLGGKVGAATQAAVSASTKLPLSVVANTETYQPPVGEEHLRASLPNDLNALRDAMTGADGKVQMEAWKNIKSKYNLSTDAIAKMFNVDPEALWGQLEKSITGTNVKMRDMVGVADDSQIEAARKLMGAEDLATFEDMNWQDAKALINQTLNNATANVTELQKQATDPTLPDSTRSMAVQRLRELGVTGEWQSAAEIQGIQGKLEASDNVIIGDKSYEVQDVLNSPDAKEAIINVLNGTADLKSLEGGPLAGLIPLIKNNADELAAKFGIGEDGKIGVGKLQQIEQTRVTNQKGITDKLTALGLPVPNPDDKEVLKSLGITDDVLNGYAAFDAATLDGNSTLNTIKSLPKDEQAGAWATLSKPGMAALLNRPDKDGLVNLLKSPAGRETLSHLSKAEVFLQGEDFNTAGNEEEEVKSLFDSVGLTNLFGELKLAGDVNLSKAGIDLPPLLDDNKDGKLDDMATIQKNMIASGKSLDDINKELSSLKSVDPAKVKAAVDRNQVFTSADKVISEINEYDYNQQSAVLDSIEKIKGSGIFELSPKRNGFFTTWVPTKKPGIPQAAFDNAVAKYNRLNDMANKMKAENAKDNKATAALDGPQWGGDGKVGWQDAHREVIGNFESAQAALSSRNPQIREKAKQKCKEWFSQVLSVKRVRQNEPQRRDLANYLQRNPEIQKIVFGTIISDENAIYTAIS